MCYFRKVQSFTRIGKDYTPLLWFNGTDMKKNLVNLLSRWAAWMKALHGTLVSVLVKGNSTKLSCQFHIILIFGCQYLSLHWIFKNCLVWRWYQATAGTQTSQNLIDTTWEMPDWQDIFCGMTLFAQWPCGLISQ